MQSCFGMSLGICCWELEYGHVAGTVASVCLPHGLAFQICASDGCVRPKIAPRKSCTILRRCMRLRHCKVESTVGSNGLTSWLQATEIRHAAARTPTASSLWEVCRLDPTTWERKGRSSTITQVASTGLLFRMFQQRSGS